MLLFQLSMPAPYNWYLEEILCYTTSKTQSYSMILCNCIHKKQKYKAQVFVISKR
jgi:hypothetical protein